MNAPILVHKITQKQKSPTNFACGIWNSFLLRSHQIRQTTHIVTKSATATFFPSSGSLYLAGRLFSGINNIIKNNNHSSIFLYFPCIPFPLTHVFLYYIMYSYSYRYKKKSTVRSLALSQFLIYHFNNNISINPMIVTHVIVRLIAAKAMKFYLTIL